MRWTRRLRLRLRSLFRSGRVEEELSEELQYHLEHLVDDYAAAGMSAEDARYAARREMGAMEPHKEACRDARGVALADSIRRDVTYALRAFRKSPGFTAVAILSLALGIGANTTIFSLWNGVLHSSLPVVHKPEQLVMLSNPDDSGMWSGRTDGPRSWLTYEEFEQLRDHADGFSAVMASQSSLSTWQVRIDDGEWEEASGRLVSGGFFQTLGVGPAIGRVFTTAEDRTGTPAAVLSYNYWQRRFGGRFDVLGKTVTVRKAALTVIGVAARGFIGETSGQQPDFWLPLRMQPAVLPGKDRLHDTPPAKVMWLHVFGRLKPNVTPAQAEAQANVLFQAGLESFYGAAASGERRRELLDQRLQLRPGARGASPTRHEFSQSLTALLAAVGVLLLIACANLANLLLARGAARRSEFALRLSLGASRSRLIRQLVTESLALAAMGGAAAVAVAYALHGPLVRMLAKSDADFRMSFALEPLVLAFILAATLAAALLFGVLPAWRVTKTDAGATLKEQSRSATGSFGQLRSGRLLVSLQLALSLPLLVGAGLLARTVYNLQRADLGFPAERLLLVRVDLREAGYDRTRRDGVLRELLGGLRRIPGVRAASFSELGVFSGGNSSTTIEVEGYTPKGNNDRHSSLDVVGPGYFSTLGLPLSLGRDVLENDRRDASSVCVINEAFAKRFFERRNPIGMRVTSIDEDKRTAYQVVGVARNARTQSLRGEVEPRYFVVAGQWPSPESPTFLIRSVTDTAPLMAAVRKTVQGVNAALPITSATSIEELMAPLTAQDRTTAQLAVVFGCVALALAAIGLYGVLSYGIARRAGEIAIRIALGAQSGRVVAMILRETIGVVCAGLVLGGGLAYAASRLIDSRLYGVTPQDPLTLASATGLLLLVALGAAYLPAQRASRLDPMAALRL
jgi:putative ABC transport system permease protein